MKRHILILAVSLFLFMIETQAQTKPRFYVVYTSCFCDPAGGPISSTGKEAYNLFISTVQVASIESKYTYNNGEDQNKEKLKRRFLNQIKIDFENWTMLTTSFVEGFSTEEEAADFRREKIADEKRQHKSQLHTVSI
jgi:hypothetical protein